MNKQQIVKLFAVATAAVPSLLLSASIASAQAISSDGFPGSIPKAICGPGDHTESGLQGETSLQEIKDMLTSKGLRIGQSLEEGAHYERRFAPQQPLSDQEQAVLNKPVTDLNLSVRARKCMNRLGINTLGELIQRTADELLEAKNFGMTSLNEVREKLRQYGLSLRGD